MFSGSYIALTEVLGATAPLRSDAKLEGSCKRHECEPRSFATGLEAGREADSDDEACKISRPKIAKDDVGLLNPSGIFEED